MVDRSPADNADTDSDYSQQHETITSSARISALLRPVMDQHAIITATLPDSNLFFNTALLAIEPDNNLLMIDELKPNSGHQLFVDSQRITLSTVRGGVEINLTANLKTAGSENGVAYYELDFPESIRYLQRRNTFRVSVSGANKIDVEIHTADKNIHTGELSDISAEGMCIRFPKKKTIDFGSTPEETQCLIRLPNKQKIQCAFKVRRTFTHDANNYLHVGGHFDRLDKIQRRAIEKFVVELQRENRKKMSR